MKNFYALENECYEKIFEVLNCIVNSSYDEEKTNEILELLNDVSKYNLPHLYGRYINRNDIKDVFKEIILTLNDKDIINYFTKRAEIIDIIYDKNMEKANASLDLYLVGNRTFCKSVILPDTKLRELGVTSFSHEMGHIPSYEEKLSTVEEMYTYVEVLPMLLEYFSFCKMRPKDGEEYFYRSRLASEKEALLRYTSCKRKYSLEPDNELTFDKKKYYMYEMLDCEKYLTSLDFSLQIIDLMKKERKDVIDFLKYVVIGDKAIKDMGEHFDIDTKGHKRLVKEYRKRIDKNE